MNADKATSLVEWATTHGATLHPSVEVYQDAQTGLSFRVKKTAATALEPYEPIVQLPTSLTLSFLNAVSPAADDHGAATTSNGTATDGNVRNGTGAIGGSDAWPAEFLAGVRPHVIGRLVLIREYLKRDKSFWYPYVQALPQPEDRESWALAPFWPADDAELLEGTNVEVGIDKIRGDVKKDFEGAKSLLLSTTQNASGDEGVFAKALTMDLYQWAYCIFSSRSFRPSLVLSESRQQLLPPGVKLDDFSVLLPLFDIGNHDMTTDIRWDLDKSSSTCALRVGKTYNPGDQVFNNYSMKTNAELLLGYGFMVPATEALQNDYTHVRKRTAAEPQASEEYLISLRPISHPSSILARYRQTLRLDSETSKRVLGAFQHVQPEMVWDIFCTLTTPDQRNKLIPTPGNACTDLKGVDGAGDIELERQRGQLAKVFTGDVDGEARMYLQQTVAIIQHKVLQELERLNETDVEVDEGDVDALTANQKLALDYRERCRMVLENTLESMAQDDGIFDDDDEMGGQ